MPFLSQIRTHEEGLQKVSKMADFKGTGNITKTDDDVVVATQAFTTVSKGSWIVDSGATCHMSYEEPSFCEIKLLSTPQDVTLGDG